jgi:hypothetical protein
MPLLSIRAYGRHRGCSHVAVLKAIASRRICRHPDGLIDSGQADRDWATNTHPAPKAPRAAPAAMPADPGFARARLIRAHYEALNAKLDYEQHAAQLLPSADVKVATAQVHQRFRDAMAQIPGEVAAEVAGVADEGQVYSILATAIRTALIEFADAVTPASD